MKKEEININLITVYKIAKTAEDAPHAVDSFRTEKDAKEKRQEVIDIESGLVTFYQNRLEILKTKGMTPDTLEYVERCKDDIKNHKARVQYLLDCRVYRCDYALVSTVECSGI